ncbi:hypothetical protein [Bradyrhizobium barranii]
MVEFEQRGYEAAVRAHEQTTAMIGENFKVVLSSAGAAVRVLLTINAGGLVALLGFIGAIAGKEKKIFASADVFIPSMTSFGTGMILAAAATSLIYFAQMAFGAALSRRRYDFDHPYVHLTPGSVGALRIGYVLQIVTISAAFGSFIAFAVGLWLSKVIVMGAQL